MLHVPLGTVTLTGRCLTKCDNICAQMHCEENGLQRKPPLTKYMWSLLVEPGLISFLCLNGLEKHRIVLNPGNTSHAAQGAVYLLS